MADIRRFARPSQGVICTMFRFFNKFYYPIAVNAVKYTEYFLSEYHHHDYPQVWYCVSGTYRHLVGEKEYLCRPGSVVVAPPGMFHGYEVSGEEEVELICLEGTFYFFDDMPEPARTNTITSMFCQAFGDELGFSPKYLIELSEEEKKTADEILRALCKNDYHRNIPDIKRVRRQIGEFFALPGFALSDAERKRAEYFIRNKLSPMMDAVSYMNKNYANKIHREELIRISTLCQTEFFRLIKKITGTTYALYLQMVRLRRAQTMITFSTFSFSYIADMCGFGSRTYMGKLFKKHFGLTMQEERKKRNRLVKEFPNMIMTHEFWETIKIE